MQSKISDFFKNPSASSAPTSVTHDDDDNDELKIWENKHHHIFNTYHRRTRSNNPNVVGSSSKPETGRTIVKNKKRSYAQFHLDFGQSDFLLRDCSTCGVKFTPGDAEDEKSHKEFHKRYTQGIQFRGWTSERVIPIPNPSVKQGRIVLVLQTDPSAHRNKVEEVVKMMEIDLGSGWILHELCKVYMFVSVQRIVGCLIAEPIEEAFKVVSFSIAGHSDSARKKEMKSYSTTLQFGNIVFQREVEKRAVSVSDSEVMDGSHGGAIFCESNAVPAVCGIRAIWVTPSNRRKRIASQLLDAVRKSFCMGFVLEPTQLAFSQPTSAGKALASSYIGTGSFLVYKETRVIDKEKFVSIKELVTRTRTRKPNASKLPQWCERYFAYSVSVSVLRLNRGLICTLIRDRNTIEGSSRTTFVYGGAELDKALVFYFNDGIQIELECEKTMKVTETARSLSTEVASNNEAQGVVTILNVCKQEVKNATLVNLSAVVDDECKMKAADSLSRAAEIACYQLQDGIPYMEVMDLNAKETLHLKDSFSRNHLELETPYQFKQPAFQVDAQAEVMQNHTIDVNTAEAGIFENIQNECHGFNLVVDLNSCRNMEDVGMYRESVFSELSFCVSDLVWGKVRGHPWWPGQIFDPSAASVMAKRHLKEDCYLIAYFGDQIFSRNDVSTIKPFQPYFSQMEKQSDMEEFQHAVDSALYEVSRRVEFGLSCPCMPEEVFSKLKTQAISNAGLRQHTSRTNGGGGFTDANVFRAHEATVTEF